MKLLLLNPNTSTAVTQLMTDVGQRAAAPGTELIPCTATRGVPYISTRTEAQIGGAIALEMLAGQHPQGRRRDHRRLRRPRPVRRARNLRHSRGRHGGSGDADRLVAGPDGVSPSSPSPRRSAPGTRNASAPTGCGSAAPASACSITPFQAISEVGTEKEDVAGRSRQARDRGGRRGRLDFCRCAALGPRRARGRPRYRPSRRSSHRVGEQAEALVALRLRKATAGTYRRPAAKPTLGLADALAARLEHRDN